MDKKHVIFFSCLAGAVAFGILIPYFAFAHKGYIRPTTDSKSWMSNISDDTTLDMISMPGTHNSGALHSIADVSGKCQDISIYNQLTIGARFLDIRVQSVANKLAVCHVYINEDLTFESVLSDCRKFLQENRSETIIFSVKEEEDSVSSTISFNDVLLNEIEEYKEFFYLGDSIPTLGLARGKMVLLSRYKNNTVGISARSGWRDSCTFDINSATKLHVQDYYSVTAIDNKKQEIESCLKYSSDYYTSHDDQILTLNFLSGTLSDDFPPSYSVHVAEEINPWALEVLPNYRATGVAIFDFLDMDLAKAVWSKNL